MIGLLLWLLQATSAGAVQAPPAQPVRPMAYVGLAYSDANRYGVAEVLEVYPDSPADYAGVRKGDLIMAVLYGNTVYSLVQALQQIPPDGVWEPRPVWPANARTVEFVIRRPKVTGLLHRYSDADFETIVASIRWAVRP